MAVSRISSIFKNPSPISLQNLIRHFSSYKPIPKISNIENSKAKESLIYRHKLQTQKPTTIKWENWHKIEPNKPFGVQWNLFNSVSFIGTVVSRIRIMRTEEFKVYTWLEVKSSHVPFQIVLVMWDEIAEIALKHLKRNDYIYVSGKLRSYTKLDLSGRSEMFYKVYVDELNFVTCTGRSQSIQKSEPKEGAISTSGVLDLEKKTDILYLWQVFFANPHEWWDNRKCKRSPKSPDFKHRDTGESLWLSPDDPPWIRRQLRVHDSRMAEGGYQDLKNSRSRVSMWKYDE
ncbi:hypothetical protein IFM89_032099 [Coptis chinensis]|uniref:Uncharacterized protein n=1 Tax=Coptis chinensis TaxID=261450 RepID=A0A835I4F5_9MAGN|nr:hypothetical protein IFM89_032099 [Coptis chinensis]